MKPYPCRPRLLFLLLCTLIFMLAGCSLPFLPRLEIDRFSEDGNSGFETMEVKGVVYIRVSNPQATSDPEAAPTLWIPMQVYRAGRYQAYRESIPAAELAAIKGENAKEHTVAPESSPAETPLTKTTAIEEESLQDRAADTAVEAPPLRRRAFVFPSRSSILRPDLVSLLIMELEEKLPLRVLQNLEEKFAQPYRLLNQRGELLRAGRDWLQAQAQPQSAQFIIFLSHHAGANLHYYTCDWIDSQTGENVASFTFKETPAGRLLLPLVPNDPTPLRKLVTAASWWCRIGAKDEDQFILEAGHRSGIRPGQQLEIFAAANTIKDPMNGKILGLSFIQPLGKITIIDFFGDDGSIGRMENGGETGLLQAYATEIPVLLRQDQKELLATQHKPENRAKPTTQE
ncbi:MAG: hypothetical protein JXR89_10395 [Deltaproteobacteria bacterium]|nr:hypothetical protein [Deltaproteobacteria bacterium]